MTSGRTYKHRTGLIFAAEDKETVFYGEAAPLPGFSAETTSDIHKQSEKYLGRWKEILASEHPSQLLHKHYREERISPALQFGLDTLAYRIEAHRKEKPFLADVIPRDAGQVKVNGLISLSSRQKALKEIEHLTRRGFETIKCKVGMKTEQEFELLKSIRKHSPGLRIRLDANRAWTLEEAKLRLRQLTDLNIEYCEEPLANPSPEAYELLERHSGIPLALDETIALSGRWPEFLSHCSVLILKPMVIGSFAALKNIRDRGADHNCGIVITSSLEGSIGRSVTALLAGGLGSPGLAHGLNTGHLLADDITPGWPAVTNGNISLSALDHQKIQPERLQQIATETIVSQ